MCYYVHTSHIWNRPRLFTPSSATSSVLNFCFYVFYCNLSEQSFPSLPVTCSSPVAFHKIVPKPPARNSRTWTVDIVYFQSVATLSFLPASHFQKFDHFLLKSFKFKYHGELWIRALLLSLIFVVGISSNKFSLCAYALWYQFT